MGVEGTGFENTMPVFELPLHFFKLGNLEHLTVPMLPHL